MRPCSHVAMTVIAAMQSLMPWRFLSLRSLYTHCSNGAVSATLKHALCSHAVIAVMQPCRHAASQPTQPLQQWRCLSHAHASCACSHAAIRFRDFSASAAYAATAAVEISQPYPYLYPCPWPCLLQPYSHCSHTVITAI